MNTSQGSELLYPALKTRPIYVRYLRRWSQTRVCLNGVPANKSGLAVTTGRSQNKDEIDNQLFLSIRNCWWCLHTIVNWLHSEIMITKSLLISLLFVLCLWSEFLSMFGNFDTTLFHFTCYTPHAWRANGIQPCWRITIQTLLMRSGKSEYSRTSRTFRTRVEPGSNLLTRGGMEIGGFSLNITTTTENKGLNTHIHIHTCMHACMPPANTHTCANRQIRQADRQRNTHIQTSTQTDWHTDRHTEPDKRHHSWGRQSWWDRINITVKMISWKLVLTLSKDNQIWS